MTQHAHTPERSLLERAEAAERTVEVLKRKVYELYNGGSQSALHRQLENARRREENNRQKRELIEVRAAELKKYSEVLEAEVARRTDAIKTILDNVTFGFLVVNRDLVVQPESTKSCVRLFDADRIEGRHLCDLLHLTDKARLTYVLSADQVFEDALPSEASIAQMPRKFAMSNGTFLQVEASVVRARGSEEVTGLLLTVSDISALEAATRESNNNRTLVNILRQRDSFRAYLADARHLIEAAKRGLAAGNQTIARHALHTIKGNSASYGLDEMVAMVHEVEDGLEISVAQVERVAECLRSFLQSNQRVLEIDFDRMGDEDFAVTREQMSKLRTLISSIPAHHAHELAHWTARVLKRPAWQALGPIEDFSQKLAARLGKTLTFELQGGETNVEVEAVRPVFQAMTHLIRNAIDHGLESPLERERKRKPLAGRLELEISEQEDGYAVRCSDDGRGIDVDVLTRRALDLGLTTKEAVAKMDDHAKHQLIFIDGLSSAPVTTSISGRGVGMSAVRSAVESVGGTITIESQPGAGTTFLIVIPKSDDEERVEESRTISTPRAVS